MSAILDGNVLISIFLVITLGTIFGAIPFGPVKFGAAGTLFVGLAIGAFVDLDTTVLANLQSLGLGLFVYMLGLSAGEMFFKGLKSQIGMMLACAAAVVIGALTAIFGGRIFGLEREVSVGVFAGSLTSTPSLAVAQQQTGGSDLPAVGYSLAYPIGVIFAILVMAVAIKQTWPAKRDVDDSLSKVFQIITIQVTKEGLSYEDFAEKYDEHYVIASVRRNGKTTVAKDIVDFRKGDVLRAMVTKAATNDVVKYLGRRVAPTPFLDRHIVIDEISVSNNDIAGRTVGELKLYDRFGARIVRVRRGDDLFLANEWTHLAYGDSAEVIVRSERRDDIRAYFGDSVKAYSQLNWVAVAGGLMIGYLLGLITIPLPGGAEFALGTALGPLLTGLVLGTVQRTGKIAWQLPASTNTSFQQLGLMLFLAAVGLASGKAFVSTAFSLNGAKAMGLGAVVVVVTLVAFLIIARVMGKSSARGAGGASGVLGQPAVLQYGLSNSSDSRVMAGYTATFAIALIVKIVIIPFMLM